MEKIIVYNDNLEKLEKEFNTMEEADAYEVLLDFLNAGYYRYTNGELLYAMIR